MRVTLLSLCLPLPLVHRSPHHSLISESFSKNFFHSGKCHLIFSGSILGLILIRFINRCLALSHSRSVMHPCRLTRVIPLASRSSKSTLIPTASKPASSSCLLISGDRAPSSIFTRSSPKFNCLCKVGPSATETECYRSFCLFPL